MYEGQRGLHGEPVIKCDDSFIPFDDGNTDFQQFKKWLTEQGQTVEQWVAAIPPLPLPDERAAKLAALAATDNLRITEQFNSVADAPDYLFERLKRYIVEADPLKQEAEAELKQRRPQKYFEYVAKRNQIRRETEPEETRLDLVKRDQLAYWKVVCDNMLITHYTPEDRDGYTVQLILAGAQGLTNRQNYIAQLFFWGKQLNVFFDAAKTAIEAAKTIKEVLAVTIDFTDWEAADPGITAAAIESILS